MKEKRMKAFEPEAAIATWQMRNKESQESSKSGTKVGSRRDASVKKPQQKARRVPSVQPRAHQELMVYENNHGQRRPLVEKPHQRRRVHQQELSENGDDVTFIGRAEQHHPRRLDEDGEYDSVGDDGYYSREPEDSRRMLGENRRIQEEDRMMREEESEDYRNRRGNKRSASQGKSKDTNNCIDDFTLLEMKDACGNVSTWFDDQPGNTKKENNNGKMEGEEDAELKYMERLRDTLLLVAGIGACGLALML